MSKAPINLNDQANKESELGTLIIVLLKARNLNDKHKFRKQDVFAQATLNGSQKRTDVDIKGGQHPEWDGEVRFPIMKSAAAKYRKLEVACYAQEPRSEDLLGNGIVDITETLRTGEFDDWVVLEIDGVQRGELYLEMTYYANVPAPVNTTLAPNKLLSVVQNQNNGLSRRPSKLSPADRLSRPQNSGPVHTQIPVQTYNQHLPPSPPAKLPHLYEHGVPQSPGTSLGANQLALPASLKPSYQTESLTSRQDALPSSNESYRNHRQPEGLGMAQLQASLPPTLRPGASSPSISKPIPIRPEQNISGHGRHPSASPTSTGLYMNVADRYKTSPISQGSSPNPYIGGSVGSGYKYSADTASPDNATGASHGSPNGPPLIWRQESAGEVPVNYFTFPTPMAPSQTYGFAPAHDNRTATHGSPKNTVYVQQQQNRPYMAADERDRDPHLHKRYQTPLPLPPGSSAPVVASNLSPPPNDNPPTPDLARIEAQRWAEDEARRRREQELKDLELAMALDRELNLADERV